ncbi:MAG: lysophospholipase [Maricaulaceae bacterium]
MECIEIKSPDGLSLNSYYWAAKKPKAIMTLMHGFGEHAGRYDHFAQHLNSHGISVLAPDLHGHGKTEGKRGLVKSYDLFRGDVKAALLESQKRNPDIPHILFGHSMGGGIVLDHGLGEPVCELAAIIASAPLIKLAEPAPKPLEFVVRVLSKIAPNATMKNPIDGTKISRVTEEQDAYLSDTLNHGTMGFGLVVGLVDTGQAALDNCDKWTTPLLLLHAREDRLTAFSASEAFAAGAQNCTFVPFENCEHEMHNDTTRDEFYKAVTDFIEARI